MHLLSISGGLAPVLFGIYSEFSCRTQGEQFMYRLNTLVFYLKAWSDSRGQDLIEYALMAGFVAVSAGAIMPNVALSISQIFSQVASVLSSANGS
jgi:pilus assembly protein Flp/PilA